MIAEFYAHLQAHHGFDDPDQFAAGVRSVNAEDGTTDPEAGTGRSTRAMLEAIDRAGAQRPIVVVAPGGDHARARELADQIDRLQIKLGIEALPIETTDEPDAYSEDPADLTSVVLYRDHAEAP